MQPAGALFPIRPLAYSPSPASPPAARNPSYDVTFTRNPGRGRPTSAQPFSDGLRRPVPCTSGDTKEGDTFRSTLTAQRASPTNKPKTTLKRRSYCVPPGPILQDQIGFVITEQQNFDRSQSFFPGIERLRFPRPLNVPAECAVTSDRPPKVPRKPTRSGFPDICHSTRSLPRILTGRGNRYPDLR